VYQNRRQVRGEVVQRSFAHCYETGGMRRTHMRGHTNILNYYRLKGGGFRPGTSN
jgi:transposase